MSEARPTTESDAPCEAIEGYFTWGVQRCMKRSVTTAIDATWGTIHPVCAEHDPERVPSPGAAPEPASPTRSEP